jgi:hypothetical protein
MIKQAITISVAPESACDIRESVFVENPALQKALTEWKIEGQIASIQPSFGAQIK